MTPEERAEKIKSIVGLCSHKSGPKCFCVGSVAEEIRAAVEDMKADRDRWADSACRLEKAIEAMKGDKERAVEEARRQLIDGYDDTLAIKQAKAEAYEDAAKIADELFHEAGNMSVDAPQPALSLINERMRIARELASAIRAIKSGDGK